MSGTKRKHDSIVPEEPQKNAKAAVSENDAPHLPSDVMAHVLDFLPFSDVRSAMLTGKHIAVHAAGQIETLNIMEARELNVRVTGTYRNVKEVNIGCILENRTLARTGTPLKFLNLEVSSDAVVRIVPFLSCFRKLERTCIYTGNYYASRLSMSSKQYYSRCTRSYSVREKHQENNTMMQSLVLSFCGGFDSGSLPQNLKIRGIVEKNNTTYKCNINRKKQKMNCKVCRSLFKSFPLNIIKRLNCPTDYIEDRHMYCVSLEDRLNILKKRKDWGDFVLKPCHEVWKFLKDNGYPVSFKDYFDVSEKEANMLKSRKIVEGNVYTVHEDDRETVEWFITLGIRPELLSSADIVALAHSITGKLRAKNGSSS